MDIQTNKGIISVADNKLCKKDLLQNGFKFSFTAIDYNGNKIGEVWSKSNCTHCNDFILELEPLDKFDISEDVLTNIASYFKTHKSNGNDLGKVIFVQRKSNHPEDNYLYEVIAKKDDGTYSVWTSWNNDTHSLNFGHYGLTETEAYEVVGEFYTDINKEG